MGLDMYLYRVSKINADRRRVYTREELEGNSWNDYSPEDIKLLLTFTLAKLSLKEQA